MYHQRLRCGTSCVIVKYIKSCQLMPYGVSRQFSLPEGIVLQIKDIYVMPAYKSEKHIILQEEKHGECRTVKRNIRDDGQKA